MTGARRGGWSRGVDDEHVAVGLVGDVGGHRAEQAAGQAVQPAVAHDQQVHPAPQGLVGERVDRVALDGDRLDLGRPYAASAVGGVPQDVLRR
jgi:hypothetical protein